MLSSSLTIEVVNSVISLETIREEWNILLEKSETKLVELTYEWQMTYWRHFHDEAELYVLLIREADKIVAIAPLKLSFLRILGIKIRHLEFIAASESNYQDIIIGENKQEIIKYIHNYLLSNTTSWDIISLRHIPESSTTIQLLLEMVDNYQLHRIIGSDKCLLLEIKQGWQEYKKMLGKGRGKKSAYHKRKLERDIGKIQLRRSLTEDELRSDLMVFFELHRKHWNKTDTPSHFNEDRYREFYLEVLPQLLCKGQTELSTMEADQIKIAQMINLIYGKNAVGQLLTYDIDYSRYSPVRVLMDLWLEDSTSKGTELIDFGSYYPYKESWGNRIRNRINIQIYAQGFFPSLIYILMLANRSIKTNLRRYPLLLKIAKRFLRILKTVVGK